MSGANLELIFRLGLFVLGLYILYDHLIRHIPRTRHKVPPSPNVPTPISLLDVRKLHQNFPRCLPLDILHQLACRYMRRCRNKQMHMIPRNMPLQNLDIIRQTDLPNQLSDPNRYLFRQNRFPVLRNPHEMQLDAISAMGRRPVKLHAVIILK